MAGEGGGEAILPPLESARSLGKEGAHERPVADVQVSPQGEPFTPMKPHSPLWPEVQRLSCHPTSWQISDELQISLFPPMTLETEEIQSQAQQGMSPHSKAFAAGPKSWSWQSKERKRRQGAWDLQRRGKKEKEARPTCAA